MMFLKFVPEIKMYHLYVLYVNSFPAQKVIIGTYIYKVR